MIQVLTSTKFKIPHIERLAECLLDLMSYLKTFLFPKGFILLPGIKPTILTTNDVKRHVDDVKIRMLSGIEAIW